MVRFTVSLGVTRPCVHFPVVSNCIVEPDSMAMVALAKVWSRSPMCSSMGAFDKLPWVDPAVFTRVSPRQVLIERSRLVVTPCTAGHPQVTQSTSRAPGAHPGEPSEWRPSYSNVQGQDRGRPRESERTHQMHFNWNISGSMRDRGQRYPLMFIHLYNTIFCTHAYPIKSSKEFSRFQITKTQ